MLRRSVRRLTVPILLILLFGLLIWRGTGREADRLIDAAGRRVFVADGDTLKIGADTIRLAGLDAVERTQFCMDEQGRAWSCGQDALAALEAFVAAGGLRCAAIEQDRYGRSVARCTVGKADVGAAMVAQGWAISTGGYDGQENMARQTKQGIWAGTFETPAVWRERNGVVPRHVR